MKHFLPLLIAAMACQLAAAQSATDAHDYEIYQQLSIFNNLYRTLDLEYVDSLKATKVVGDAIESMLGQLDPYTEYFPEENTDELRQLTTGKYAGIGSIIAIDRKQHRCYIADPYRGMPADKAGLRFGDVIMAQDGTDYGLATEGKEQCQPVAARRAWDGLRPYRDAPWTAGAHYRTHHTPAHTVAYGDIQRNGG